MSPIAADKDYETVLREMITQEDELVNERMLWMAAFNGLLFAALGFAWGKPETQFILTVFAVLGVLASLLNVLSLSFASMAQRRLLQWWDENKPEGYNGPGVMGQHPLDRKKLSLYITPWVLLAIAFAAGWVAILLDVLRLK